MFDSKPKHRIILFVDERWSVVDTIKTLLEKNGYEVIIAHSDEECLRKLKKSRANLLLIGYVATRGAILDNVRNMKKLKIAYLITDESEAEHLELYANVVGFLKGSDNINVFLEKIKAFLK